MDPGAEPGREGEAGAGSLLGGWAPGSGRPKTGEDERNGAAAGCRGGAGERRGGCARGGRLVLLDMDRQAVVVLLANALLGFFFSPAQIDA